MKATFTINVEITADEFVALAEKWEEIHKENPITEQPIKSWVGKKVEPINSIIKENIYLEKEYIVAEEDNSLIKIQTDGGISSWLTKTSFILV